MENSYKVSMAFFPCVLFRLQSHNYEERYRTVEGELRKLVAMRGEGLSLL